MNLAWRGGLARGIYLLVAAFFAISVLYCSADNTWTYAVQLSSIAQSNPPRITLNWRADPYNPQNFTVYRKLVNETAWSGGTVLPGSALSHTDYSVTEGVNYEYKVVKNGSGYTGYGYICAGMNSPMIEHRGKIVLIIAADTSSLSAELQRLEWDLAGDGWQVLRHDTGTNATATTVKNLIVNDYYGDPANVKAVFLLGRVPVVKSGYLEYDGHGARSLPADAFYADVDGDWRLELDPTNRPSYLPTDVELMAGRVDFSNMPGNNASGPWPNETELLRRYLNKDHAWRHKVATVPRRALMANRVGDATGMAYASSGYRNFEPLAGPGNIVEANVEDIAPDSERWISKVTSEPWLWTYACGAGTMTTISHMGLHGDYHEAWSTDVVAQDAKSVFSMILGSHFGEWHGTDNLLRAIIAAPSVSLTACLVGLPHWFVHHMAKGEPIGYSTRLTMNNSTLYENQSNALTRAVTVNLMGDPTLRMEAVSPPRNLTASGGNDSASLNWGASADSVLGYHVYRAAKPSGPYHRLTPLPVTQTKFIDSNLYYSAERSYMVRALALQTNPSGTYQNLSQGVFATATVGKTIPPPSAISTNLTMTPLGPQLRWNTEPGRRYHVETKPALSGDYWIDLSGPIPATSSELTYTDRTWIYFDSRFYRVLAE